MIAILCDFSFKNDVFVDDIFMLPRFSSGNSLITLHGVSCDISLT